MPALVRLKVGFVKPKTKRSIVKLSWHSPQFTLKTFSLVAWPRLESLFANSCSFWSVFGASHMCNAIIRTKSICICNRFASFNPRSIGVARHSARLQVNTKPKVGSPIVRLTLGHWFDNACEHALIYGTLLVLHIVNALTTSSTRTFHIPLVVVVL